LVRCPSACGPSDDPKHRMVWHPPLLVRDIGIHAEEPPRLPLAQVGTQHRCFRLCRLAIVPSCKPWDICCPSNPTATLECVAQNCPRRITILRSPAMRETAFDVLINPCVRSVCSRSVAVGLSKPLSMRRSHAYGAPCLLRRLPDGSHELPPMARRQARPTATHSSQDSRHAGPACRAEGALRSLLYQH